MELIAAQYRGRARVLQAKLFVQLCLFPRTAGAKEDWLQKGAMHFTFLILARKQT